MFEISIYDRYQPRRIQNFNEFSLALNFDSTCDTFGFMWLFDEKNYDHKELLCLSHFHPCDVYYNNELIIAGIITNNHFGNAPTAEMVQIGGWSRPGVLENSCVPIGNYPLQTTGLSILQVAKKLCDPYNVKIIVDPSVASKMNSTVTDDNIQPTDTIKSYLQKITEVKRIIMSHTPKGELLFTEAKTNAEPVIVFNNDQGSYPGTKFSLDFKGEEMHRFITVVQQGTESGSNGGQHTIRNPYVINTYVKDKTVTSSSGIADDVRHAARQELSKELQNITLNVDISGWRVGDKIIKPGDLITVYDEKLYIYKKVNWFVKSANYTANSSGVQCTLVCVLPDVFTNTDVQNIFANINIHGKINGYEQ